MAKASKLSLGHRHTEKVSLEKTPLLPEQAADIKYKQIEMLPERHKEDVLRMFGEFCSFEQIKHHILLTYGEKAVLNDLGMIQRLCSDPRHKFTVMQFRNRYLSSLKDMAIFHKKVRLADLQVIRDRYVKQIEALSDANPKEREEFRYMARGLGEILSTVRDEVEGKGMSINVGFGIFDMGDLDGKSDDELISRRDELLKKAQRALGVSSGRRVIGDNGDTEGVIETTASEPS